MCSFANIYSAFGENSPINSLNLVSIDIFEHRRFIIMFYHIIKHNVLSYSWDQKSENTRQHLCYAFVFCFFHYKYLEQLNNLSERLNLLLLWHSSWYGLHKIVHNLMSRIIPVWVLLAISQTSCLFSVFKCLHKRSIKSGWFKLEWGLLGSQVFFCKALRCGWGCYHAAAWIQLHTM